MLHILPHDQNVCQFKLAARNQPRWQSNGIKLQCIGEICQKKVSPGILPAQSRRLNQIHDNTVGKGCQFKQIELHQVWSVNFQMSQL